MIISGQFNRLYPDRPLELPWERPTLAERELEQAMAPVQARTAQEPFTPRPVLEPEEAERFSRRHARPSMPRSPSGSSQGPSSGTSAGQSTAMPVMELSDLRTRAALDAYHEVGTNQHREYVRSVFGIDLYA